jgi:aromatic-L-amino-acid/L-tryptophan decarboxylase
MLGALGYPRRPLPLRTPQTTPPDPLAFTPAAEHPLELSEGAMRAMVDEAMRRVLAHITSLPEQRMHPTGGGQRLARALREPMPERGAPYRELLALLFDRALPATLNTASPGYLAYIPGGGLFHAAVADLIALATNRYVGLFRAAPGLVQLEANVIRWFSDALGLPATAGGVLTSGGSLANFIAVVTARRERLPPDFLRGVIYTSSEAHHSVLKAALLAGFPPERVRALPADARFRLPVAAVEDAIRADRAAGLTPFMLVASAGTTNTGAIDDLEAFADLSARERLWLHVDAAYGGFFALTERGQAALRGIERADSVTLDPHKGLFLPYGTGCLLARDVGALRRAHAVPASYLPPMQSDDDLVDFCEISPELSREARGLRAWLPLKMHGAAAFRAALDEKLDLARLAAERLRAMKGVTVVAEPALSLLAFRARPPGVSAEDGEDGECAAATATDAWSRRLLAKVNEKQRVFLTGTVSGGRFLIRMCVLSFRTHRDRVEMGLADIEEGLRELTQEG